MLYPELHSPETPLEAFLAAYFHDFNLFNKYFKGEIKNSSILSDFICRGMIHDLNFALNMFEKYFEKFSINMRLSFNSRLIMSDIIPKNFKDFPCCIWYPNMPSYITLNKLIEFKEMHVPIAFCAMLLNDRELFNKLYIPNNRALLYQLGKFINCDFSYLTDSLEYDFMNFKRYVNDSGCNFFPFMMQNINKIYSLSYYLSDNFFENNEKLSYIEYYNYRLVDEFYFERLFCIEFNLFEYLNPDILFILGFFDKSIEPFNIWFKISTSQIYLDIFNRFKNLKYNVGMAIIKAHFNFLYFKFDFLPDMELIKMASISGNKEVYDDQIKKYNNLGYCYQHLDLINKVNVSPPKIIFDFNYEYEFNYSAFVSSPKDISDFIDIQEVIINSSSSFLKT